MEIESFKFAETAIFQKGADTSNPQHVGEHLERIRASLSGRLTPEAVVADARSPNSPLHSFFEWDDSAAAQEHRLQQARGLIRTVVAIYKEAPERGPIRAYVNVRPSQAIGSAQSASPNDKPFYVETTEALSKPDMRLAVLKRAKAELAAWAKRYNDLKELASIVRQVSLLAEEIPEITTEQKS